MTPQDIIKYLGNILNINIQDKLTLEDMLSDLSSIHDLALFREFIKARFNYEKYQYLTGYQKFLALKNDFKKEFSPRLDEKLSGQVENFSNTLYKKTCDIFDEVNFQIQNGKQIEHFKMEASFNEKELKVLNKIGNKIVLLNLVNRSKLELEIKIKKIVSDLTLQKIYPQLANKSNDKLLLEKLQKS